MKHFFLLLIPVLLLSSCGAHKGEKFDYTISANPWIDCFKDQVFFAALKEAYKENGLYEQITKKDALNPYDGLNLEAIQMARALGTNLIKNIPPPAMCESCEAGENYYMAVALHYYASADLDAIAQSEYKKQLSADKAYYGEE